MIQLRHWANIKRKFTIFKIWSSSINHYHRWQIAFDAGKICRDNITGHFEHFSVNRPSYARCLSLKCDWWVGLVGLTAESIARGLEANNLIQIILALRYFFLARLLVYSNQSSWEHFNVANKKILNYELQFPFQKIGLQV